MIRPRLLPYQIGILVAVLTVWQLAAQQHWLDPFFFSQPAAIGRRIVEWFASGFIYRHLWTTALETVLAFLAGAALGVAFGFWFARSPALSAVFDPYLKIGNALPRVVLAPIFTLWFGLGVLSKVAFGVTLVFFIVFFNTYQGIREVDANLLNNARMLGATERDLVRHVLLPSALVWILSSLHTSVGLALVGAVVGEYLGAGRGLGYVIAQSEGTFDTTGVFAGMTVLAVFTLAIDFIVTGIERRLLSWKPDATGRA
ncbi:MAG TPA: ABC transporter permease [bacterium]|nr:ABC transporter permease [bacterium]